MKNAIPRPPPTRAAGIRRRNLVPLRASADRLGASYFEARRRVVRGEWPAVRIGDRWFLEEATIDKIIDDGRAAAEAFVQTAEAT